MRSRVLLASAAIVALFGLTPANATLQFWANINGTIISCADQAACDTNPLIGQLSIADQTVAGVQILGVSGVQTFPPPNNALNSSTLELINLTGASVPITAIFSGTSFIPPTTGITASGGGTFENAVGSDITLSYFADTANGQGAPGTPGAFLTNFNHTDVSDNPDSFAFNSGLLAFAATDPFSMTFEATGNLAANGTLVGRTQAQVTEAVPLPATMWFFGAGLAGVYVANRRRKKSA